MYTYFGIFVQSIIIIGEREKLGSYIVKLEVNMDMKYERGNES